MLKFVKIRNGLEMHLIEKSILPAIFHFRVLIIWLQKYILCNFPPINGAVLQAYLYQPRILGGFLRQSSPIN